MSDVAEVSAGPRSLVGVILVGSLLGPVAVMLWLDRWRLALLYFVLSFMFGALLFLGGMYGLVRPIAIVGIELVISLMFSLIAIAGLAHALWVRKSSLGRSWLSRWFIAFPLPGLSLLLVFFLVREFIVQPFGPALSGSSRPNYVEGDYFLVSKFAYWSGRKPERGVTAAFKLPADMTTDYIKRVSGLPGDRIQMIDGVLHINGEAARLDPVELAPEVCPEGNCRFYRETLPEGQSYVVTDMGDGPGDNTVEYLVPAGHYFVLGDNRDNSQDSRYRQPVGYVPEDNFTGPVVLRYWNSEGFRLDNRPVENAADKIR